MNYKPTDKERREFIKKVTQEAKEIMNAQGVERRVETRRRYILVLGKAALRRSP